MMEKALTKPGNESYQLTLTEVCQRYSWVSIFFTLELYRGETDRCVHFSELLFMMSSLFEINRVSVPL